MRDGGTGIGCDVVGGWEKGVGKIRWLVLVAPAEDCVKERMSKENNGGGIPSVFKFKLKIIMSAKKPVLKRVVN